MAKDKLIPTWLKVAAVAALFVPYKIKVEKDKEQKIKRVTARCLVTQVTFEPGSADKESDLHLQVPGFNAKMPDALEEEPDEIFDSEAVFSELEDSFNDILEDLEDSVKKKDNDVLEENIESDLFGDELKQGVETLFSDLESAFNGMIAGLESSVNGINKENKEINKENEDI